MQDHEVKVNFHVCKHCQETGTCTSGEDGNSCMACIKYHELKRKGVYKGLACGTCGGLGQSEPTTERINKRFKPLFAIYTVCALLVCLMVLSITNNQHFSEFLVFAGTITGSITTFYFSGGGRK